MSSIGVQAPLALAAAARRYDNGLVLLGSAGRAKDGRCLLRPDTGDKPQCPGAPGWYSGTEWPCSVPLPRVPECGSPTWLFPGRKNTLGEFCNPRDPRIGTPADIALLVAAVPRSTPMTASPSSCPYAPVAPEIPWSYRWLHTSVLPDHQSCKGKRSFPARGSLATLLTPRKQSRSSSGRMPRHPQATPSSR